MALNKFHELNKAKNTEILKKVKKNKGIRLNLIPHSLHHQIKN